MRAAVCHKFGEPLVIERVCLDDPEPGEVLVEVRACAICHSDISYAQGAWGGELPAVYGHEAAGVVREVGQGVSSFAPGDHVVVTLIRSCGHCRFCRDKVPVMCDAEFPRSRISPIIGRGGKRYWQGMGTAAFAERIVVHESQMVRVAGDIRFEVASLLACGVITGFGAVTRTAALAPGQSAVVVGCGGVGLNAIQAASIAGADLIVAVDLSEDKLAAALRFGASHCANPEHTDPAKVVMALTGGQGADFVFITTGARAALGGAQRLIGKGGTIVVVGMPENGVTAGYDPSTMAARNQRIVGSRMGNARIATDIPRLLQLYRAGRLKLDELISGRYPLEQINEAIASVATGAALRNVIVFG